MRDEERQALARRALSGDADALLELVDRAAKDAVEAALNDEELMEVVRKKRETLAEQMVEVALKKTKRVIDQPVRPFADPPPPIEFAYATNTANLRRSCPACGASPPCAQDCR